MEPGDHTGPPLRENGYLKRLLHFPPCGHVTEPAVVIPNRATTRGRPYGKMADGYSKRLLYIPPCGHITEPAAARIIQIKWMQNNHAVRP